MSCKWHLLLDVTEGGSILPNTGAVRRPSDRPGRQGTLIRRNHPTLAPKASQATAEAAADAMVGDLDRMEATCVLDLIDEHGPLILERIAALLGLTRERVRQIETNALAVLRDLEPETELTPD